MAGWKASEDMAAAPWQKASEDMQKPQHVIEGASVGVDRRFLGHRSIVTTEIYTHVADAALKSRVVERHPRKTILQRR